MRVRREPGGTGRGRPGAEEQARSDPSALEWLGQFRKAMDLCAMYPLGHPAAVAAASGAYDTLQSILAVSKRAELLALEKQLYFNRRAISDPEGRAADLAERMRRRAIRGIAFHSGTTVEELATCLQILTASPQKLRAEGGASAAGAARGLRRIVISDLDYARIALTDDPFQAPAMHQLLGQELCHFLSGRLQAPSAMVLTEAHHLLERATPVAATLSAAAEAASHVPGFETPNLQATVVLQIIQGVCRAMLQGEGEWTEAKAPFSDALVELPSPLRSAVILCTCSPPEEGPDFFERILDDLSDEHVAKILVREAQDPRYAASRVALLFGRLVRSYDRFVKMEERLRAILSEEGVEELFNTVIEPAMLEALVSHERPGEGSDWAPSTDVEAEEAIALQLAISEEGGMVSHWQAIEMLLQLALASPDAAAIQETVGPLRTALSEALTEGDHEAVSHAFSLLSREASGGNAAEALLGQLFDEHFVQQLAYAFAEAGDAARAASSDVLLRLGAPAVGPLSGLLRTAADMDVVRDAAALLARIPSEEAEVSLAEVLADPDEQRRLAAAQGLSAETGPRAQRLLTKALSDPAPQVREAAALALGRRRYEGAVELLGQLAVGRAGAKQDPSRVAAISALGQIGSDRAVRWLGEVLGHRPLLGKKSHEQLQLLAIRALGEAGTDAAGDVLEQLAKSGPRHLRAAAEAARQRLGGTAG